jgi:hypothetical protein
MPPCPTERYRRRPCVPFAFSAYKYKKEVSSSRLEDMMMQGIKESVHLCFVRAANTAGMAELIG